MLYRIFLTMLVFSCLAFSRVALASSSGWQEAKHLRAELVSEYQQVVPGQRLLVALHFIPDEHWHTYWINPGDSGLPTSIDWQLPEGVIAGAIQWPTPQFFSIPPMMNYGFAGPTVLLTELTIPAAFSLSELALSAKVDWLVCEEICIPAEAGFSLTIPVSGNAKRSAYGAELISKAHASQPQPLALSGYYDIAGGSFSAAVTGLPDEDFISFFVAATELVDHAAPQQLLFSEGEWLLRQKLNTYFTTAPEQFELVLVSANGQGYSLTLKAAADLALAGQVNPDSRTALWAVLLMAAAGGFILNLMPCVFPVLSLKALSIAGNSGQRKQQQRDALWYSLGVVLSFVALAAVLLALRAAGTAVGWGFQLQSPLLVAALAYLLFVLGLSLSGLVQFGLGLMNAGGSLTQQKGAKGSFFTGVLAVIVASPCTAPFMGGALGYAVTQPPALALLVFVALGLGMALPFLLLAYIPALAQLLPKPGGWMETLKQLLAYPLYLSAIWLAWVFGRQTGIDALALLLCGAVALAAACWLWGRWQFARKSRAEPALAVGLVVLAFWLVWVAVPAGSATAAAQNTGAHWQNWSAERQAQLQEAGKPVLVNMTADWCITCLVNERVALNTDSSKAALALYDVTYLKGDWTRRDAAITAYLHQYQRDGVPLYVLYWPGQPAEVLPQILTPDTLRQTLERLSKQ